MRSIVHWLSLLALLVAPLAAPAAASAPLRPSAECQMKAMGGSKHAMPRTKHHAGESCCLAIPPAIDPPHVAIEAIMPIGHLPFAGSIASLRLGAGPPFEDPPPRFS
jgi:hypothetical protein